MDNFIRNEIIATESAIRRAALTGHPFMLKGSYVTRQYFKDPSMRIPMDLDWVYLERIEDPEMARNTFDDWAIKLTELDIDSQDGVSFRSFREDAFWRRIDYSMAEDFPTVNTDLAYKIDGESDRISIDISFNLDIEDKPVPLLYQPMRGPSFTVPDTAPLSLQVSWKLHQTLVRARFKDIFDLIHLLVHPAFTDIVRERTINALMKESAVSNVQQERIHWLFSGQLKKLYPTGSLEKSWNKWRFEKSRNSWEWHHDPELFSEGYCWHITAEENLPASHDEFEAQFYAALHHAGLKMEAISDHPYMLGA